VEESKKERDKNRCESDEIIERDRKLENFKIYSFLTIQSLFKEKKCY